MNDNTGRNTQQSPQATEEDGWWRPLSDKPVAEVRHANGKITRIDQQGRTLCGAKRRDGKLCMNPIVTGLQVCRMHGGSTQKARNAAKLRLAELVNPAISTLARTMAQSDSESLKLKAAVEVLDRTGHGKSQTITVDDAKQLLYQKMLDIQEEAAASAASEQGEEEA